MAGLGYAGRVRGRTHRHIHLPDAVWFEGGMFNFSQAQQKSLLSPEPECCADGQGWNSPAQGLLEQADAAAVAENTHKAVQHC